ncbi:MAG TPA: hypothetical protein VF349_08215 [Candidatus Limnocylindrales bacterium]
MTELGPTTLGAARAKTRIHWRSIAQNRGEALPDDKPDRTTDRGDRKRDFAFLLMFPNTLAVVVIGIAVPIIALGLVLILGLTGLLH